MSYLSESYDAALKEIEALKIERDGLGRMLHDKATALHRAEAERDAAIAHAGECRAALYRIVDIWDGPLYKHEMLPAITKAREVLKGGE